MADIIQFPSIRRQSNDVADASSPGVRIERALASIRRSLNEIKYNQGLMRQAKARVDASLLRLMGSRDRLGHICDVNAEKRTAAKRIADEYRRWNV